MDFLIQGIGLVGALFAFIAFQSKKHFGIMVMKICSSLCFVLQFTLMKAYTGIAMNAFGIVVFIIDAILVAKNKKTLPFVIISTIICVVLGIVSWIGCVSLFAIIGESIVTVSCGIKNSKYLRYVYFFGSVCWLIFDIVCFTLGGIITEVFSILSIIIATIRVLKKDTAKANRNNEQ